MLAAAVSILVTLAIVFSVLFEAIRFFQIVPLADFVTGLKWSPQMALRADQAGSSGAFGAIPLFAGTLLITAIAMFVAVPIGLLSAIYMSEYASRRTRNIVKPLLELLAGIPTVVYGYFAITLVSPALRTFGTSLGQDIASESALAAGLVMGVMIIPFVSSLSDDIITAVPQRLRDASYGMGATMSETIRLVVFPAALPGIMGAVLLAISRAIGETMIVVMAAGAAANLTANPFQCIENMLTLEIKLGLIVDMLPLAPPAQTKMRAKGCPSICTFCCDGRSAALGKTAFGFGYLNISNIARYCPAYKDDFALVAGKAAAFIGHIVNL
jgi:phosphate transport system permease protein